MFKATKSTPNPKVTIKKGESGKPIAVVEELIRIKNLNQICHKLQGLNCDRIQAPGCSILAEQILKVRGITCL